MKLPCGRDMKQVGIELAEGWSITAFIRHLERCEQCGQAEKELVRDFNRMLTGVKGTRGNR